MNRSAPLARASRSSRYSERVLAALVAADQDPEKLNRLYGEVATYLLDELGVDVEYIPVIDYTASVSSFRIGDIDAKFTSVFIANTDAGIDTIKNVAGLETLKDHTLTFGSEVSTCGRLMPQYFLDQAGVELDDLSGQPGFSGSHDTTIKLVEAGTFEAGALNAQVWKDALAAGTVDPARSRRSSPRPRTTTTTGSSVPAWIASSARGSRLPSP